MVFHLGSIRNYFGGAATTDLTRWSWLFIWKCKPTIKFYCFGTGKVMLCILQINTWSRLLLQDHNNAASMQSYWYIVKNPPQEAAVEALLFLRRWMSAKSSSIIGFRSFKSWTFLLKSRFWFYRKNLLMNRNLYASWPSCTSLDPHLLKDLFLSCQEAFWGKQGLYIRLAQAEAKSEAWVSFWSDLNPSLLKV